MNPILAKVFVQLGVIRQGTVLEAYQSAKGLSCVCDSYREGRYVVLSASMTDDWVYFRVASNAAERHRIRCDYVTAIDGMAIERVAAAHQLRMDGSPSGTGVRRGRKRHAKPVDAIVASALVVVTGETQNERAAH